MFYYLTQARLGQTLGPRTVGQVRVLFTVYAIGFTAIAVEIWLLNYRAWRLRGPLRLNAREQAMTRGQLHGWSIPVTVGLISLLLALILPYEQLEWSGWVYFSMAVVVPLHSIVRRRRLAAAMRAPAAPPKFS